MRQGWLRKFGLGALALAITAMVGCSSLTSTKAPNTIKVLGKSFTEQDIMANLVGVMLEKNTDLNVKTTSYLGGTDVVFKAITSGNADAYVEYSGTALMSILNKPVANDPQTVYDTVKSEFDRQYQLAYLKPLGFNNTYALAVTEETAKKYNLKKVSDLKDPANSLLFGTEAEFLERPDGMPGLQKTYGLKFKDIKSMDIGLKYKALTEGQVDVIDAFTTDGQLAKQKLVLLEDDKKFFPPYYPAPVVRNDTLKKYPQIGEVLNKLAGKIDERQMAELNAQVDIEKKKARDVAQAWLKQEGLIK